MTLKKPFTANTADRRRSPSIFDGIVHDTGINAVRLGFGTSGGMSVSGIQDLVQYVTAALLTEKGSDPYDPQYGTEFITAARTGAIRSDPDVALYFNLAASSVLRYFRKNQDVAVLRPDEVLRNIELVDFIVLRDGPRGDPGYPLLRLTARVYSFADSLEVPLAVPVA